MSTPVLLQSACMIFPLHTVQEFVLLVLSWFNYSIQFELAPGQGNDPRSLESESSVMPLDQPGVGVERIELSLPLYQSGVLTVRLYSRIDSTRSLIPSECRFG